MTSYVEKNEDEELPVPIAWRPTLCKIVEAFKLGDFQVREIPSVEPLNMESAKTIDRSIRYYGDTLISLPNESWETSVYRWTLDYWEVLVDLFTLNEGRSDLVLFVNVFEKENSYKFQVQSVHVP